MTDGYSVTTFFHAWRRNQANRQAAEWLAGRAAGRPPVPETPAEIRDDVRRLVDTLLEGGDGEVEPALKELWDLLADRPELRARFARLRIVGDAVDFKKNRTAPHATPTAGACRPAPPQHRTPERKPD